MWKRLLLSGPLLGTLLLLAAADPPAAWSSAPGTPEERSLPPREGPYPGEDEHGLDCPVCRAAERVGLHITPLVLRPVYRCTPQDPPLTAAAPRGRVRMEDLQTLHVHAGLDLLDVLPGFEEQPSVELRCGETLLGQVRLPEVAFENVVALPQALRARLSGLRGRITWGRSGAGSQALASIWIDPPSVRERARHAEVARGLAGEPRWIRRVLEAQLLLDEAFDHAALRTAQAVLRRRPEEPHAAAIANAAYGLMGMDMLPDAYDFNADIVRTIHARRRRAGAVCHLDDEAQPLRSREPRPVGGCGGH